MKTEIIIALVFLASLALFIYVVPFNPLDYVSTVQAWLTNAWQQLNNYGLTPLQLIAGLGGVTTVFTAVYGKIRASKLEAEKAAQAQITQAEMDFAAVKRDLTAENEQQKTTITAQAQEIEGLKAELKNAPSLEQYLDLQKERDLMEQTYQKTISKLKQEKQIVIK